MNSLKFIREPGYIYDLIFIFVYHFNRKYCLSHFINQDKFEEDTNFFNGTMFEFSDIPEELLLFFYLKENGKCFFSEIFYECHKDRLSSDYNLTYIQRLLLDNKAVVKNMLSYYFIYIDEPNINFYCESITEIGKLIDNSDYNDTIKSRLFSFFINPNRIIENLNIALFSINSLLSKYYERNVQTIINAQNRINIDELSNHFKQMKNHRWQIEKFENIYLSICLLNKNCIKSFLNNDITLLLGYDYKATISYLTTQKQIIALDEIANVLSEKNRINILDALLEKGESSIRDIENDLNISSTNAYYHITMMLKANLLKSRNEGKIVLYSLNKNFFNVIINHLKKYYNGKE